MTVADLNPSTVPFYTTQNGSSMDFIQRAYNSLLKAFMWAMTVSQCLFCDWIIQEYLKGVPRYGPSGYTLHFVYFKLRVA